MIRQHPKTMSKMVTACLSVDNSVDTARVRASAVDNSEADKYQTNLDSSSKMNKLLILLIHLHYFVIPYEQLQ